MSLGGDGVWGRCPFPGFAFPMISFLGLLGIMFFLEGKIQVLGTLWGSYDSESLSFVGQLWDWVRCSRLLGSNGRSVWFRPVVEESPQTMDPR